MKFTAILALVASASAMKLHSNSLGLPVIAAPSAAPAATATAVAALASGPTFNYQTTGGHPGVHRLPNPPPAHAVYRLGGDGDNKTGIISQPQKGLAAKVEEKK